MNPLRRYTAVVCGVPYPVFACGCNDAEMCKCNSGVRREVSQAELLAEAKRASEYPVRANLLLTLASFDQPILIDSMRQLAEAIHAGEVEFHCAMVINGGPTKCCVANIPVLGERRHLTDASISRWLGVPRHPSQPPESKYCPTYVCPACGNELIVWQGKNAHFKTLQKKLWEIVVFDLPGPKRIIER
jgi:hypothetical protein